MIKPAMQPHSNNRHHSSNSNNSSSLRHRRLLLNRPNTNSNRCSNWSKRVLRMPLSTRRPSSKQSAIPTGQCPSYRSVSLSFFHFDISNLVPLLVFSFFFHFFSYCHYLVSLSFVLLFLVTLIISRL